MTSSSQLTVPNSRVPLCTEAAREIQRGGHSGRHRILERRFQHDTAIDDLHGDLQLVVELHVALPELRAGGRDLLARSEEHTSELQSLMRISYAVFCLKKKNN